MTALTLQVRAANMYVRGVQISLPAPAGEVEETA